MDFLVVEIEVEEEGTEIGEGTEGEEDRSRTESEGIKEETGKKVDGKEVE